MLLIFGIRNRSKVLGTAQATCPQCGARAAQRVDKLSRAFSLFFVPVIPMGSEHVATCTACGLSTKIDEGTARAILSGAY